jgi:aminoglycoside/choline kinase family phosphotransferase
MRIAGLSYPVHFFEHNNILPCMEEKTKQRVQAACDVLHERGVDIGPGFPVVELLAGDGSQREFYRLRFGNGLSLVIISPAEKQQQGMAEALSSWSIGKHLYRQGVPVPELFGFDGTTGLIVSEDLGDIRLHEYVQDMQHDRDRLLFVYRQVIRELVRMQVRGREDFDPSWCWQTQRYDRQLMLERESGYFRTALCRDFFDLDIDKTVLVPEFEEIADQACRAPADYFLHRDFQSRNIMLKDGRVGFIDYQGGRLGPLGYDLASLVTDPYAGLPERAQEILVDMYVKELSTYITYDSEQFRQEYLYLSLQRNLQILGAFAFLSKQRNKPFFRPFIRPALKSLQSLLAKPQLEKYSSLKHLTAQCLEKAEQYDL